MGREGSCGGERCEEGVVAREGADRGAHLDSIHVFLHEEGVAQMRS